MNTSNLIALLGLIVGFLGLQIAIVKEWSSISTAYDKLKSIVKPKFSFTISRRKCIFSIGGIVSLLVMIPMIPIEKILFIAKKAEFYGKSTIWKYLILNNKSGVVHHKIICADHLPIEQNRGDIILFSKGHHLHRSKAVYIAETLSKLVEDSYKEILLIEAIRNSPTSTHLYGPLIKMWGKNREYLKIHSFLSANIDYFQGLLERTNITPRVEKKYRKSLFEAKQWQDRANYLRRMSKILQM